MRETLNRRRCASKGWRGPNRVRDRFSQTRVDNTCGKFSPPPMPRQADLPLRYHTPPSWAIAVLREPLALLNDHAHLEKKAATNALELLNCWPEPNPPVNWVMAMTAGATRSSTSRSSRACSPAAAEAHQEHANPYASELHKLVRKGRGPEELVDRLMISSLIEARPCERFRLLGDAVEDDRELQKLYRGLWGRSTDT